MIENLVELLTHDESLTAAGFCEHVRDFVVWCVDFIESHELCGRRGWLEHLEGYQWRGSEWRETLREREERTGAVREGHHETVREVLSWGHVDDMDDAAIAATLESLAALNDVDDGDWGRLKDVNPDRVAATTKVFATAEPDRWAIYDSRVGISLSYLINKWWACVGEERAVAFLGLRLPGGESRSGYTRVAPAGFSSLQSAAPIQARLSVLYASWLIRCIAAELHRVLDGPDHNLWRTVHVEMVLFTLGQTARNSVQWWQLASALPRDSRHGLGLRLGTTQERHALALLPKMRAGRRDGMSRWRRPSAPSGRGVVSRVSKVATWLGSTTSQCCCVSSCRSLPWSSPMSCRAGFTTRFSFTTRVFWLGPTTTTSSTSSSIGATDVRSVESTAFEPRGFASNRHF